MMTFKKLNESQFRALVKRLIREECATLDEDEEETEPEIEEISMVAGIAGATTPLGTSASYPSHVKKRSKKKAQKKDK